MTTQDNSSRLTFFFPEARVLRDAEVEALPPEKRKEAEKSGRQGVWLEINCPEEACIGDDGKITISAAGTGTGKKKGLWLNLFCPEDSCEIRQNTDLP
ncbi:MAG: hypothetical protein R6V60_11240 [Desulfobacterales bacterium]|jgi:hypothetical protein